MEAEEAESQSRPSAEGLPGNILVRLHLIGRMNARAADGQDVLLRARKTRALLAIVALSAPRPVRRTRLAHLLWSGRPEEQSRASLRQEIHQLRASLSRATQVPDVLQITRDHLSFRPGVVWVDVQEIMRAKTDDPATLPLLNAAELLEDLNGVDPAFNAWLARERQQLRDHSRQLVEALLLKQIDPDGRVSAAQCLLQFDRSHEGAWRALMRAHADRGERGMAIRAYESCRAALAELLDAEPSCETETLLLEIRGSSESPSSLHTRAWEDRSNGAQPQHGGEPRIGILPFQMLATTEEETRLGSSLVEEITCALTKLRWISVISSNAFVRFAAGPRDEAALRRAFGIDFLLEGTIRRRQENQLRIMINLLDLRSTNRVVWADSFDRRSNDALSVWDDLAGEVASRIATEIQLLDRVPRSPRRPRASKSALCVDSDL